MIESLYTCVNCQLTFPHEEDYKQHYRSEHHRYNIKRKLIGLPPLSLNDYTIRITIHIQSLTPNYHPNRSHKPRSTANSAPRSSCLQPPTNNILTPKNTKTTANNSSNKTNPKAKPAQCQNSKSSANTPINRTASSAMRRWMITTSTPFTASHLSGMSASTLMDSWSV